VWISDHTVLVLTMVATWLAGAAVALAWGQIRTARQQAQSEFEDDLSREYRSLVARLPPAAFYSDPDGALGRLEDDEIASAFYRYFDLSNEQLFYARLGRVSESTARQWRQGIEGNLHSLPAFAAAWKTISARIPADYFEELRALLSSSTPHNPPRT
jgi:hypothetical protein